MTRWLVALWGLCLTEATLLTPCKLCPFGTVANPERVIPLLRLPGFENPTCQQAMDYAPTTVSESTCGDIMAQAAYCGCEGFVVPDPADACSLCDEALINGELATPYGDMTCTDLHDYLQHLTLTHCDNTERGHQLQRHAFLCGCPSATTHCAMCSDGSVDLQYPERVVPFFTLRENSNPTCQQVANAATLESPLKIQCDLIQQQAGYCGCANTSPVNACSFCANQDEPANMDTVTSSSDTCRDLHTYISFMDEATCATERFKSMQGFDYQCGCSGAQPACSLCPDGSQDYVDTRQALPDGTTCALVAHVVQSYTTDVCLSRRHELDAIAARCGCPGASFPICNVQQTPHLCTHQLLDTVADENCECYSFCDGVFQTCHDFPGGILNQEACDGVPIAGCNRANARHVTPDGDDSAYASIPMTWMWLLVGMLV